LNEEDTEILPESDAVVLDYADEEVIEDTVIYYDHTPRPTVYVNKSEPELQRLRREIESELSAIQPDPTVIPQPVLRDQPRDYDSRGSKIRDWSLLADLDDDFDIETGQLPSIPPSVQSWWNEGAA
jgi:hypothetical protein